ncbi:MAG: LacI family DNA-binding transcriptional regulator [Eubacteriales bacterium]|nr:LacI family DNA-binding transcriptional regulator [Eubacteriales bacterium]
MKVTINDVARHAGVSTATVSHVINHTRFVSEATRQRVLDSINALEYTPNEMARILKTGKKNMIGFIVPDISNEYFAALIEEVERVIAHESYKLIVTNTHENEQNEIDTIRALTSGMVDGLLIASTVKKFCTLQEIIPKDFPVVLVDRTFPDCTFHSLTISNHRAVYQGVREMIRRGHKNIGYIAGLQHISTAYERFLAYKAALTDCGLPIRDELICFGDSLHNSADAYVGTLISRGCTAIAISNNAMAEDVIYYCHKHGIVIGQDVDLLTSNLDDRRYYYLGKMGYVRQPALELAQAAGQQIMDCISNPSLPIKERIFQAYYVEIEN